MTASSTCPKCGAFECCEEIVQLRYALAMQKALQLEEARVECEAWKAKTREDVRKFLTEHPDLRIRQLSDQNGVLEAQLDLAKTKLLRAIEALKWYANPDNNGKRTYKRVDPLSQDDWPIWRPIDDDEGEVAREMLEAIGDISSKKEAL